MKQELFNDKVLLSWREIDQVNWPILAKEIADVFFEVSPLQLKVLFAAFQVGNLDEIRNAAHSLKSSCGNVGAMRAFALAQAIEEAARNGEAKEIEARIGELGAVFSQSTLAVKEFIRRSQAA